MLKNYMRVALRNLKNHKAFSVINIIGLAVGIACCIAILLYVEDELSYDKFNKNAGRIYRPTFLGAMNGHDIDGAMTPAAMGPAAGRDIPEVAGYVRLYKGGSPVLRYMDKTFSEERFFWADSTIFEVFTLPFVSGNPKTALTQPNTVVITKSMARKYFGSENPIGKILNMDKQNDYIVTGLIEDIPINSHFHPDFIGSFATIQDSRNPTWLSNNYYTYFLLQKGASSAVFERKLNEEVRKYFGAQMKAIIGVSMDQFLAAGNRYGYILQPLSSIHLHSHLDYEMEPNSSITYVYMFSIIAIAILLIACINFINLATARSEKRAKEVGVRKTLGSLRSHLVYQFLAESILMSGLAVILAVGIVELFLPLFNDIANKQISFNLFSDALAIPLLLCFAVVVGIVAGSYPAFYLSSFRPIDALKPDMKKRGRKSVLRNGLVIFQFTISIVLFIGTFIIYTQLKYVQTKNLGFDKEETIVINRTDDLYDQIQSFEHELKARKDIVSLSNSTSIPGDQRGDSGFRLEGISWEQIEDLRQLFCDYDFADAYRLRMAEGRFFSRAHPSDSAAVVVNEDVERAFGTKNIVGKFLIPPAPPPGSPQKFEIVGVVKNFNYQSLHEPVRPLVIHLLPEKGFTGRFVTVRLAPGDHAAALSYIAEVWKKYTGNEGFSFNFLDENLQRLYAADKRTNEIAGVFSILAIFVACLGLLGLAAFVIEQKTKEIGIRKVLGASVPEIVILLSKEFVKWVLVANLIAWPIAYYVMEKWLLNFAYRMDIGIGIFMLSGLLALFIALLTVSSHAIKAATANPVESLRYE
jgi:putative ABC transport system permease protein